jgi:putative oxidoreductase
MKKILSVNNAATATSIALLVARFGIAALMLTHGVPKLLKLASPEPVQFASVFGLSPEISLALAVFAEVICSLFLLIGFATRLAVIPIVVTMLVAVTMIHGGDAFSAKEPALHYLLVYFILFFGGSGKYSVDYLLQEKKPLVKYATQTRKQNSRSLSYQ